MPGAETIKGGIIGIDFLRPNLGVSLALDDLLPSVLLEWPLERPFPFSSIAWKPFVRLGISEDELSGVARTRVMGYGYGEPSIGVGPQQIIFEIIAAFRARNE